MTKNKRNTDPPLWNINHLSKVASVEPRYGHQRVKKIGRNNELTVLTRVSAVLPGGQKKRP